MKYSILSSLTTLLLVTQTQAFVPPQHHSAARSALAMVEGISVAPLDNHAQVGDEIAGSVQRWLDFEWMPQQVHEQFGESCKQSYIKCREAGQDDLMAIMTTITDDLNDKWAEYDKDAFVNAWDISNYVSDFLTEKVGIEGCACSAQIH